MTTAHDNMRLAFAALLRGDTAERDRLCKLVEQNLEDEKRDRVKRLMEVDFFVTPQGIAIPITRMLSRA